jgi:hypothetical protein
LQPFLRIFAKSPTSAIQSVLHVLFLPTPFKILSQTTVTSTGENKNSETPLDVSTLKMPEEVLFPGALYADCAAVKLQVKIPEDMKEKDRETRIEAAKKKREKGKAKVREGVALDEEVIDIADDGEYGGELAGRLVWEETLIIQYQRYINSPSALPQEHFRVIIYEKNIRGPPAAGRTVNIISNSENPSKCLAMSMILTLFYFELEPGVTTF